MWQFMAGTVRRKCMQQRRRQSTQGKGDTPWKIEAPIYEGSGDNWQSTQESWGNMYTVRRDNPHKWRNILVQIQWVLCGWYSILYTVHCTLVHTGDKPWKVQTTIRERQLQYFAEDVDDKEINPFRRAIVVKVFISKAKKLNIMK